MHKLFNQSYVTDAKKHRVCQKESSDLKLLYYLKKKRALEFALHLKINGGFGHIKKLN